MARAPALHAGGQGFDSLILHTILWKQNSDRVKFFDMLGSKQYSDMNYIIYRHIWMCLKANEEGRMVDA